jgi:hypothetical protein
MHLKELPAQKKESSVEGQKFEKISSFQVVGKGQVKSAAAKKDEERNLVEVQELFHSLSDLTGFGNLLGPQKPMFKEVNTT